MGETMTASSSRCCARARAASASLRVASAWSSARRVRSKTACETEPLATRPSLRSKSPARLGLRGLGAGDLGLRPLDVELQVVGLELEQRLALAHARALVDEDLPHASGELR